MNMNTFTVLFWVVALFVFYWMIKWFYRTFLASKGEHPEPWIDDELVDFKSAVSDSFLGIYSSRFYKKGRFIKGRPYFELNDFGKKCERRLKEEEDKRKNPK